MKKSVIVLILLIYVFSIFIIGFFGIKVSSYLPVVYVEEIQILNEEMRVSSGNIKFISFDFQPFADETQNTNHVQLEWKVLPENSTTREVNFIYDDSRDYVAVSLFGTVTFTRKGVITITIVSQDGTNVRESVQIIAK